VLRGGMQQLFLNGMPTLERSNRHRPRKGFFLRADLTRAVWRICERLGKINVVSVVSELKALGFPLSQKKPGDSVRKVLRKLARAGVNSLFVRGRKTRQFLENPQMRLWPELRDRAPMNRSVYNRSEEYTSRENEYCDRRSAYEGGSPGNRPQD
jgi:hypothetical protein